MPGISLPLAFVAGFVAVTSPCVLPILPILLGSALQRNRLYPVFVVLGLASTFALLGVLFGSLGSVLGLGKRMLESAATAALFLIGLVIVIKPLGDALSRLTAKCLAGCRFGERHATSDSGLGAFAVGCSLGIVWAPCAGPVLASILALAASSQSVVAGFVLLAVYALGAGVPMLLIAYGGRRLLAGRRLLLVRADGIKAAFGWLLVFSAVLLHFGAFRWLETLLLPCLPSFVTAV